MKPLLIIGIAAALIWIAVIIVGSFGSGESSPALEEFARCLSDKRAVMYGADWCPHCQNQKNMFGVTFRKITYVECPDDPKKCLEAGIQGYPTWIFADGSRIEGEASLDKLAKASGCELNQERPK